MEIAILILVSCNLAVSIAVIVLLLYMMKSKKNLVYRGTDSRNGLLICRECGTTYSASVGNCPKCGGGRR